MPRSPTISRAMAPYVVSDVTTLTLSARSEEHTSELQSPCNLVCRLLLEKKKQIPVAHTLHHQIIVERLTEPRNLRLISVRTLNKSITPTTNIRSKTTESPVSTRCLTSSSPAAPLYPGSTSARHTFTHSSPATTHGSGPSNAHWVLA